MFLFVCLIQCFAIQSSYAFSGLQGDRQQTRSSIAPTRTALASYDDNQQDHSANLPIFSDRRTLLKGATTNAAAAALIALTQCNQPVVAALDTSGEKDFLQKYADFTESPSGWRFRDVKTGAGETAKPGDRVVYDWSGYTIGYFGRPFEAKGGPQGGAFDKDIDYYRTVIGSGTVVKGLEESFVGMKQGSIRQVVIPYGPLSYPDTKESGDASHEKVGPKPTTFSGQRALNFVLDNPRVDRTLLFNVKVVRIDKPNGKGGFARGS